MKITFEIKNITVNEEYSSPMRRGRYTLADFYNEGGGEEIREHAIKYHRFTKLKNYV